MKQSGVYSITNITNGHKYIGSSVNIHERWYRHKLSLSRGKHHSKYLQRAWDKYGKDNFVFEIIELVNDKNMILIVEQNYMDTFRPVYNNAQVAGNCLGCKHSEETKRNTSLRMSGINHPLFGTHRSKETRKKISEGHKGIRLSEDMKKKLRGPRPQIMGKNNSFYGKRHSEKSRQKMSNALKGEKHPFFGKIGNKHHASKPVNQLSKDNVFVASFEGTRDAGRKTGIDFSLIGKCCRKDGIHKTAGGFIWRYAQ